MQFFVRLLFLLAGLAYFAVNFAAFCMFSAMYFTGGLFVLIELNIHPEDFTWWLLTPLALLAFFGGSLTICLINLLLFPELLSAPNEDGSKSR